MSRSRKKTPIIGVTCARSEKEFKQRTSRAVRRLIAIALRVDPSTEVFADRREVRDIWNGPKDGKTWWPEGGRKTKQK